MPRQGQSRIVPVDGTFVSGQASSIHDQLRTLDGVTFLGKT
jgi:hypothetical protein